MFLQCSNHIAIYLGSESRVNNVIIVKAVSVAMLPPIPSLMVFLSQISIYAIGQLQLNLAGAAATDHRWPFPCDRFPLWPQAARLTLDSRIRQTGRKPRLAARHEWCQDAVSILPIVLEMQSNSFTSTICILKMQNPFSSAEMQSEFSYQY